MRSALERKLGRELSHLEAADMHAKAKDQLRQEERHYTVTYTKEQAACSTTLVRDDCYQDYWWFLTEMKRDQAWLELAYAGVRARF